VWQKKLDHAVLVVGFGASTVDSDASKLYWNVKNSWNADWGEKGYFRVARGKDMCGVADGALYPVNVQAAKEPTPLPAPTEQCPAIPVPPPRLPVAYTVNVTQTWGDPKYPSSGIVAVSYTQQKMLNTGYYMMSPETKLYRCDLNPKAQLPGKAYYINGKGKCVDGFKADPPMNCPWSRWTDEVMSSLISAQKSSSGKACPVSPYGGGVAKGTLCDEYIAGGGSDFVTTFWVTSKGAMPVKEFQVLKGKQGFSVTTYFSDWKVGEPAESLFAIPSKCPKVSFDVVDDSTLVV